MVRREEDKPPGGEATLMERGQSKTGNLLMNSEELTLQLQYLTKSLQDLPIFLFQVCL